MKVKDLIEELKKYDLDNEVTIAMNEELYYSCGDRTSIKKIDVVLKHSAFGGEHDEVRKVIVLVPYRYYKNEVTIEDILKLLAKECRKLEGRIK